MAGEVLDTQEFESLEELVQALEYWKNYVPSLGHDASTVLPISPGKLVLIEETLTDGSKVLNFAISGAV
jgi:hypothetical protein